MMRTLSFKEIREILPHRYPFLLLDRVIEIEKGKRIVCLKNISGNENFFVGHFPQEPIMPGVLITEIIAQAAFLLMSLSESKKKKKIGLLGTIDKMYFLKPVIPGDQLKIDVEIIECFRQYLLVSGKVSVDGEVVAKGNLGFVIKNK